MGFLLVFTKIFAGYAKKPPLSGEVARRNAETERLQQICDDLSVTFGDSVPTPFVPSGHFPLIGGIGPLRGEPLGAAEWAHNMLWGILRLPRKMGRKGLKGLENRRKA